jgi:hypothetical protein
MRAVACAWTLACLALLPGAQAFLSSPEGGSPHDRATREAARQAGLGEDAVRILGESVRDQDEDELGWHPDPKDPARRGTEVDFAASHHCDRVRGDSDGEALEATRTYIRERREDAARQAEDGNHYQALVELGRGLHALQDCFSHTDAVEQGPEVARRLARALVYNESLPAVRVMGVDPEAEEPGAPVGDPFPHDGHNHDSPDSTDAATRPLEGGTGHEVALRHATEASALYLGKFRDDVGNGTWRKVAEVRVAAPQTLIPSAGPAVAACCLAGAAYAAARRQ